MVSCVNIVRQLFYMCTPIKSMYVKKNKYCTAKCTHQIWNCTPVQMFFFNSCLFVRPTGVHVRLMHRLVPHAASFKCHQTATPLPLDWCRNKCLVPKLFFIVSLDQVQSRFFFLFSPQNKGDDERLYCFFKVKFISIVKPHVRLPRFQAIYIWSAILGFSVDGKI